MCNIGLDALICQSDQSFSANFRYFSWKILKNNYFIINKHTIH